MRRPEMLALFGPTRILEMPWRKCGSPIVDLPPKIPRRIACKYATSQVMMTCKTLIKRKGSFITDFGIFGITCTRLNVVLRGKWKYEMPFFLFQLLTICRCVVSKDLPNSQHKRIDAFGICLRSKVGVKIHQN